VVGPIAVDTTTKLGAFGPGFARLSYEKSRSIRRVGQIFRAVRLLAV
jgi:hypothetical protein